MRGIDCTSLLHVAPETSSFILARRIHCILPCSFAAPVASATKTPSSSGSRHLLSSPSQPEQAHSSHSPVAFCVPVHALEPLLFSPGLFQNLPNMQQWQVGPMPDYVYSNSTTHQPNEI
ncbi:hypothetical protein CEP53_014896, partial [Fusarium sp. AF-6]